MGRADSSEVGMMIDFDCEKVVRTESGLFEEVPRDVLSVSAVFKGRLPALERVSGLVTVAFLVVVTSQRTKVEFVGVEGGEAVVCAGV